jgi:hypothetical protein
MTLNHSTFTRDRVMRFLSDRGGLRVTDLRLFPGGEFSRAYAYRQADQDFVVRFSSTRTAFEKDRIA